MGKILPRSMLQKTGRSLLHSKSFHAYLEMLLGSSAVFASLVFWAKFSAPSQCHRPPLTNLLAILLRLWIKCPCFTAEGSCVQYRPRTGLLVTSTEKQTYLWHCDGALLRKLLFGLLAGIRVTEVRVEILIQNLCRLLAKVAPFPPG